MKISTKFTLMLLLPLVALIAFGGLKLHNSWQASNQMVAIADLTTLTAHVSSLVHETQKERGCTAGFLGSKGTKFSERLTKQRELTNQRAAELHDFLIGFDSQAYGTEFTEALQRALNLLDEVDAKREQVSALTIPTPQAIGYYTRMNGLFLTAAGKASTVTTDGPIAVRINAYNAFLQSKERAGIERAVLANTFAQDKFGPGMYEKFTVLVALQDTYLASFTTLATGADRDFCTQTLNAPCVQQVANYRTIARENHDASTLGVDATVWFDTISEKINLLKKIDDYLAEQLLIVSATGTANARASLTTAAVAVLLVSLATVALSWFILRSTTRQLRQFANRIREIAEGEGDLTQRVEVSRDEIGEVAHWFNQFTEKIAGTVRQIGETSSSLDSSAAELLDMAGSLNESVARSKQQANTIAAAAEEMSVSTNQTASATEQMSTGMNSASEAVATIRDSIGEIAKKSSHSTEVAKSATTYVEASNQRITELGAAAQEIGNVIDVIEDIAEQTNLLALNATIEAARAGEAGKGFAVVATEVKELAKQTSTATDGIRTRVLSMQECTEGTVESISEIDGVIREVYEISAMIAKSVEEQSSEAQRIAGTIDETAHASGSVSSGVGEFATTSSEVSQSIHAVDTDLNETANSATQALKTGNRIESLSRELSSFVGQFRV